MSLLLDLGYTIGLLLASPWIAYRLVKSKGWRGLPARFGFSLAPPARGSIWLHGSSAGEVSLLRPLVARLERERPDATLIVSTYTTTGFEAATKAYPRHRVILFPFDFSWVVRRFLRRLDPRLVVIVESEFWPNFLLVAESRGVPVVVLNGKMSEKSFRAYCRVRVMARVLRTLDLIAVQSDEHADRVRRLGVPADRVHVTGNMKYDMTSAGAEDAAARHALRIQLGFAPDDVVVIGGSLHPGEHEVLIGAWRALPKGSGAALIIVPRYPQDAEAIMQHVDSLGLRAVRKTALDRGEAAAAGRQAVLIVDTVGDLGRLYGVADIAFVGGSLFFRGSNKGGHNLMEPAILGVPVLFGPYNFSFKETVADLLANEAGMLVRDEAELGAALAMLVAEPERRRAFGERARRVVLDRQGATQRNFALLSRLIDGAEARLQAPAFDRTMPRASGHLDSR